MLFMRLSRYLPRLAAGTWLLSSAMAFAQDLPPLLPNEVYYLTKNGCGMVFPLNKPYNGEENNKQYFAERVWSGACPNGLAEGPGVLDKPEDVAKNLNKFKYEYAYGRFLGKMTMPDFQGGDGTSTSYTLGARNVNVRNVANPFAPRWSGNAALGTMLIDPDGFGVTTWQFSCFVDQKAFRGCDLGNDFQVHGLRTWSKSNSQGVVSWCPNPRSPNGCEALWQEKAGPIIARIKSFIADAEKKIAEDKLTYAELALPWSERSAQKKLAQEAEAKRLAVIAANAREKDKEIAALEQQERDALEAKLKEKEEKAFQASLRKLNAGELFALADERRNAGETDKAREILRTLITRFHNNPLVALAAQQMSQLPASKPVEAPIVSKPTAPAAAKMTTGRDAGLEEMSGALGARKK